MTDSVIDIEAEAKKLREKSPKRKSSGKPVKKHKYVPDKRNSPTKPPVGYRRSTCLLGHFCRNEMCYQGIDDPDMVWDRNLYQHPTRRVRPQIPKGSGAAVTLTKEDIARLFHRAVAFAKKELQEEAPTEQEQDQ